jgi:hypothetical protein
MNSADLPDDLSQWPRDPYQLLGVAPGVDARDLRRAYTRLIRTYKPEQHPDHFRRIREAYEYILRQLEFFRSFRVTPAEEESDAPSAPPADDADAPEPEVIAVAPRPLTPAEPDPLDELNQLWQRVAHGDEAAVYRRLRELHDRQAGNVDVCLRLYWLLVLLPELDPARSPCEWLVSGLRTTGLTGGLRELYRREIMDDPREAASERCGALLQLPVRAGVLADFAEWRWQAVVRVECWSLIGIDLPKLRPRIVAEDEETWIRLLMTAVEQLIALPDAGALELAQECWHEVGQLHHLHQRAADTLDRLEVLMEVAAGWRLLLEDKQVPAQLLRLIPHSWSRPFPEVRPNLLSFLEQMLRAPGKTLDVFDHIARKAPAVLPQFGQLLALLEDTVPSVREIADVSDLARAYLEPDDVSDYALFRLRLLEWCIQEALPPETAAAAVADGVLAECVTRDLPLRLVCWGCRLFWA